MSSRLLSSCVNGMPTMGALESFGGLIFVSRSSVVIGSVMPVVWPGLVLGWVVRWLVPMVL